MRAPLLSLALTAALAAGAATPPATTAATTAATTPASAPTETSRTAGAGPERLRSTGGGSQLLIAHAPRSTSTTGTLTWWDRHADGRWVRAGSAPARFGARGLVPGDEREQGTSTTPAGLYALPFAFGLRTAPPGTSVPYRPVHADSWWCQDNASREYNRFTEPLARDCRAAESERLADYEPQYRHALVIAFNYDRPVRGRGAGIFLHVNGRGATAGCVSVPEGAMRRVLDWADPDRRPHIAIGTDGGATALGRG